jgi:hypothetical protein
MGVLGASFIAAAVFLIGMAAYLIVMILSPAGDKCTANVKQKAIGGAVFLLLCGIGVFFLRGPFQHAVHDAIGSLDTSLTPAGLEKEAAFITYIRTNLHEALAGLVLYGVLLIASFFIFIKPVRDQCPVDQNAPLASVHKFLEIFLYFSFLPLVILFFIAVYWLTALHEDDVEVVEGVERALRPGEAHIKTS